MADHEPHRETADLHVGTDAAPRVVAIGADAFIDRPGGLGRYAQDLTAAGSTTTLIVLGRGDAPAGIIGVSGPDAPLVARIVRMTREVLRADPDVVDVHFALYGLLPVLLRPRRPVVAHHQGPWAEESHSGRGSPPRYGTRDLIERFVLRRAHTVVTLSDAFREGVIARHGLFPARVVTVPPGVTCPPAGDPHRARSLIGVDDETPVVVAARRLVPRTGVDILLRAWVDVVEHETAAHLVVVGEGPEAELLRDLAAELGVEATVTFTGRVADAALADLWAAAEVAVVPTRALEGFGLVLLEAGCHGTASVVTDVGALPEVVGRLSRDLVVRPDPRSLAVRLQGVLDGSSPAPERSVVRAWARSYDWQEVARTHTAIYRSAVDRSRPRVVFIVHTALPSGGELALCRLLEAGPDLDAHVISLSDGPVLGRLRAAGVTSEVVPFPLEVTGASRAELSASTAARLALRSARAFGDLGRRLRALRPDVTVATSLKSGLLCSALRPTTPGRFVWSLTDHLDDPEYPATAVRAARMAARGADATMANSASTRASWGLPASDRHVVVHPGHQRLRAATPPPDEFVAVMVGRIAPWKGQHVFLEAFARAFPPGDEPCEALIAGTAMFGEHDYETELHARSARGDLSGRVHLLGHVEDPEEVLDRACVVVHASTAAEPFGQVIVEAMAAGRPVIASAAGGATEIVTDGVNGLLTAPGDVDALAGALTRLRTDPQLRRRLADAGVERARQLSIRRTADAASALLRGVTAST